MLKKKRTIYRSFAAATCFAWNKMQGKEKIKHSIVQKNSGASTAVSSEIFLIIEVEYRIHRR